MGVYFTDQFSLLHFASGIIAIFWEISLIKWFILHIVYELFTNTHFGINFINKYTFWPGGKLNFDTTVNIIGDQLWALIGWLLAYFIILYFYSGSKTDKYI
jgi:hypothetical protein